MILTITLEGAAHLEAAVMDLVEVKAMVEMVEVAVLAAVVDMAEAADVVDAKNLEGGRTYICLTLTCLPYLQILT